MIPVHPSTGHVREKPAGSDCSGFLTKMMNWNWVEIFPVPISGSATYADRTFLSPGSCMITCPKNTSHWTTFFSKRLISSRDADYAVSQFNLEPRGRKTGQISFFFSTFLVKPINRICSLRWYYVPLPKLGIKGQREHIFLMGVIELHPKHRKKLDLFSNLENIPGYSFQCPRWFHSFLQPASNFVIQHKYYFGYCCQFMAY